MAELEGRVAGKRFLITGGLGMIGSTATRKLVAAGAQVTIIDACIEPYGANEFNLDGVRERVRVNIADIRDNPSMTVLLREQDVVLNLAGQVSHNDSMTDPFLDADINYIGHLNVLEILRRHNPRAVVVHAGSRLQYGRIERVPVDESHPLNPRTPYALNKTSAEKMYLFYHQMHGIPCVLFRIANPYGPRSQMRHAKYSMINWFIRQAMDGKPIRVFGDGSQIRDYIYVDDLADALILAALTPDCVGRVLNVGSGVGTTFAEMCETVAATVPGTRLEFVPWPEDYVNVETGDYVSDIARLSELTGWSPAIDLPAGIERTYRYYEKHRSHYW